MVYGLTQFGREETSRERTWLPYTRIDISQALWAQCANFVRLRGNTQWNILPASEPGLLITGEAQRRLEISNGEQFSVVGVLKEVTSDSGRKRISSTSCSIGVLIRSHCGLPI